MALIKQTLLFIFCLGFSQALFARVEVQSVQFKTLENGLILNIYLDKDLPQENVTGWVAKNGWFYLTLYDVELDSAKLVQTSFSYPILDFQALDLSESSQIGIKLAKDISEFEFYLSSAPSKLIVNLRYPIEDVELLASLKPKEKDGNSSALQPESISIWKRVRTLGYFLGSSVTITGILQHKSDPNSSDKEIKLGIVILLTTRLLDWIIPEK